jgi:hypothetical protein
MNHGTRAYEATTDRVVRFITVAMIATWGGIALVVLS